MKLCKACGVNPATKREYYGLCAPCRSLKYGKSKCPHCGQQMDKKAKMCQKCSIEYSRRFQVTRICQECGKEHVTKKSQRYKYCSGECRMSARAKIMRLGGEHSLRWKGEPSISNGYVISYDFKRKKRIRVHVQKAEAILGRRLKPGECVHHIDMDKTNNENSNLLICSLSYHKWLHYQMERDWVEKVLKAKR